MSGERRGEAQGRGAGGRHGRPALWAVLCDPRTADSADTSLDPELLPLSHGDGTTTTHGRMGSPPPLLCCSFSSGVGRVGVPSGLLHRVTWPCSPVLWEPGGQVGAPPGLVSVGTSLSPETGPGLVGEACPRSPPAGPDGPGAGLAPCSRLRPKQGRAEGEAPRVGPEPLRSQPEVFHLAQAPHGQRGGEPRPGLRSCPHRFPAEGRGK